jgi:hypothetical protein
MYPGALSPSLAPGLFFARLTLPGGGKPSLRVIPSACENRYTAAGA